MKRTTTVLGAILCCLFVASAGHAQRNTDLTMVWRIVPQQQVGEEVVVKSNDIVTRARIVPMSMVVTSPAVISAQGEELLPAGSQLAELSGPSRIACNTYIPTRHEVLGLPVGLPRNRYLCLMDIDAEGSFESATRLRSLVMTAFVGVFRQPEPRESLVPIPYTPGNPLEWRGNEYAEFRYLGKTIGGTYRFGMTPRREDDNNVVYLHVRDDKHFDRDDFPTTFDAFGTQFEILGLERGRPRIRVLTPFPDSPFMIRGYGG